MRVINSNVSGNVIISNTRVIYIRFRHKCLFLMRNAETMSIKVCILHKFNVGICKISI